MNRPTLRSRIRGFVLGYCLGDAFSRRQPDGRTRAGTAGTLFLANVEGAINGVIRADLKGMIGGGPHCCWHATIRWALRAGMDGLPAITSWQEWAPQVGVPSPYGWLQEVPSLRGTRGPSPSITAALGNRPDQWPAPETTDGELAIARVLPVALLGVGLAPGLSERETSEWLAEQATVSAGFSHRIDARFYAASIAQTAGLVILGGSMDGFADLEWPTNHGMSTYPRGEAVSNARDELERVNLLLYDLPAPSALAALHKLGSRKSALRAVSSGLAMALTHRDPDHLQPLLDQVASRGEPGPGALAMALAGAHFGAHALPPAAIDQVDIAHVADTLANDLADWLETGRSLINEQDLVSVWLSRYPTF